MLVVSVERPWRKFTRLSEGSQVALAYLGSRDAHGCWTGPTQFLGNQLPRIHLPRTGVHKVVRSSRLLLPVDLDEQHPSLE